MDASMDMSHMPAMGYMAPLWFIYSLSALFFAGGLFYYYRLVKPTSVRAVYGYYDWQNEFGHGICLFAMASALAPTDFQLPALVWAVILGLSAIFFLIRACTFGRRLPYNKWWWDWTHVAMLASMSLMFLPVDVGVFSYVLEAFWLWFTGYYVYELVMDLQKPKVYYIGSDVSHLVMGAAMFVMTAMPMVLMAPGASMPGMNMPICHGQSAIASTPAKPAEAKSTDMENMPGMPVANPDLDMNKVFNH